MRTMMLLVAFTVAVVLPNSAKADLFEDPTARADTAELRYHYLRQKQLLDELGKRVARAEARAEALLAQCNDKRFGAPLTDVGCPEHNQMKAEIDSLRAEFNRQKTQAGVNKGTLARLQRLLENFKTAQAAGDRQRDVQVTALKVALAATKKEFGSLKDYERTMSRLAANLDSGVKAAQQVGADIADAAKKLDEGVKAIERYQNRLSSIEDTIRVLNKRILKVENKLETKQDMINPAVGLQGKWLGGSASGGGLSLRLDLELRHKSERWFHLPSLDIGYEMNGWAFTLRYLEEFIISGSLKGVSFRGRFGVQAGMYAGGKGVILTPALPLGLSLCGRGYKFFLEGGPIVQSTGENKDWGGFIQVGFVIIIGAI